VKPATVYQFVGRFFGFSVSTCFAVSFSTRPSFDGIYPQSTRNTVVYTVDNVGIYVNVK